MLSNKKIICPDQLLKLAKTKGPVKVVIVNAGKALPIESAKQAVDEGLIDPIFIGDKEKIHDIMNKYNVIEEYNIKRIYPYAINIKIIPTKYLARTSYNNQLLVGANGKLINDKENTEILPYIFGEFNSKNFLSLKKNVEQSKFTFKEFKTLYFFQSNRWDILTNNDILIKLPLNFTLESLNLAYKIIGNDKIKKKIIDLRIKNHLVIK